MHYAWDSLGRLQSITYPTTAAPDPLQVNYAYDAYGDLASVKNADTGTVYWKLDTAVATPAVNAWGEVRAGTLGNGVDVQHDYDLGTGALANITAGPNHSANLVSLAYGYGPLGNTTSTFDVLTGVGRTLSYDNLSRLHQNVIHNASGDHAYWTDYEPDGSGNIASRTGVGTYDYKGAQPHAVTQTTEGHTATGYAYNSIGQMTSGGNLSNIQWTAAGRAQQIAGAQTTNLAYDTDGNLLEKTVAGTASRYFGKLFVKVGEGWRERIVANGEVIAVVNVTSTGYTATSYLVHDAQGSPAVLLDQSGNLMARFAWDAWGDMVDPDTGYGLDPQAAATKEALTTIGYTGHEEFWKAGLVQTYARLYNPHLGRWLSPDPTVPNLANGQSFNRYSYVLNNPLTYTDPLGHGYLSCKSWLITVTISWPRGPTNVYKSVETDCTFSGSLGGPSGPGSGSNGSSVAGPVGNPSSQQEKTCITNAHGVMNNLPTTAPNKPGAYGVPETPGTAAIDRSQWLPPGSSSWTGTQANAYINQYRGQISGYIPNGHGGYTQVFNGVSDNMGPLSGVERLLNDYPGRVLFELPGGANLGDVNGMKFEIPAAMSCPHP